MKFYDILERGELFDSHCHLNVSVYDEDRDDVVERAVNAGVNNVIDISNDTPSSIKSLEVSKEYSKTVYSAVGIHPEVYILGSDLYDENFDLDSEFRKIEDLVEMNIDHVAMIGETGLDYYWLKKGENQESRIMNSVKRQQELFIKHIKLANKYNLPLTIHSRSAVSDCIRLVAEYEGRGVFHSLTNEEPNNVSLSRSTEHSRSGVEDTLLEQEKIFYNQVNDILELGFLVGINGIITYKNAEIIQNVFRRVFRERFKGGTLNPQRNLGPQDLYEVGFVLETDGPFLSPTNYEPVVKRRNEPESVKKILEYLTKIFH